ncbi:MAG TPA: tetratricopeptide repeat protein [Candidatus Acidoferrum sp.]|nr:tetratricopeptide repeat protein [Candidatus Acidoferrum sp.]
MKQKKARRFGSPPGDRSPVREQATRGGREQGNAAVAASSSPWWGSDWLFGLFVIFVTVLVYHPAWRGGFIWDDDIYVSNNPLLTAPDGWRRIWLSLDAPSQYFPLTYTVFRLERGLFGLNSTGFHCFNIFLHAANALLVWRVLRRLNVSGARLAALIFAVHPVQVESVAWITELKNVLSLFFCLLAMLTWLAFIEERARKRWRWYVSTLLFYLFALLSKSTACTLPAAMFLVLWLKRTPITKRRLAQIVPFIAVGLGMGLLAIWWEHYHQGTEGASFGLGPLDRLLLASRALWFYAAKLICPAHLTFSYPRWTIRADHPLAYSWLAGAAVLAWIIYAARRRLGRGVETAALFYVATLSPMLGFIMLYTFEYTFVADHYQYVACIGPIALVAAGMTRAVRSLGARDEWLRGFLCVPLVLALGVLTWRQSETYADVETLWRRTLANNPESVLALNNLGNLLLQRGDTDEALRHFAKAIELRPDFPESHSNLGNAFAQRGEAAEAMVEYQKALQLRPGLPEVHNNLGNLLARQGRVDEAVAQFQQALALRPGFADGHNSLGILLLQQGRVDEAIPSLRKALELRPDFALAHNSLGLALLEKGQLDEALGHFQKALELRPDLATAHNNLGSLLFQKGRLDEALAQFRKAVELRPDFAEADNNLGKVLLRKGQVDSAVIYFQRALTGRPDFALARSNLDKALLQKGQPQGQ